MTDDSELQPAVAAQFQALAELLSSASDAAWNTESLCDGWRVREVVAHMTMPTATQRTNSWRSLNAVDSTSLGCRMRSPVGMPSCQLLGL